MFLIEIEGKCGWIIGGGGGGGGAKGMLAPPLSNYWGGGAAPPPPWPPSSYAYGVQLDMFYVTGSVFVDGPAGRVAAARLPLLKCR